MTPPKTRPAAPDTDSPEANAEWFANAAPATQVLPNLMGAAAAAELLTTPLGRRPSLALKTRVSLRLDTEIVEAFKRTGAGWQTRLNDALREWLASH